MRLTSPKVNIMNSILDNQNTTTETGTQNSYKAIYRFGAWTVLATDNNGVWVTANPGRSYSTKDEAVEEAEALAEASEGTYLGVFGE